jgi:hypothetical protein
MANFENRALVMLRLMLSTRRCRHPQALERQYSFEARPRSMNIELELELKFELIQTQTAQKPMLRAEVYARALHLVVAAIISRRRVDLAAIFDMYMPRSLNTDRNF